MMPPLSTPIDQSSMLGLGDDTWRAVAVGVVLVLPRLIEEIRKAWENAQVAHQKRALLNAYRRRHQWRKADVPRLRQLGIAQARVNRIIAQKRRGRGVVQPYRPLGDILAAAAVDLCALFDPETPPRERIRILRRTPFWPYVVEALYRGEYVAAKRIRARSPSESAEQSIAACLGISQALVHKVCQTVRQDRRREAVMDDIPAISLVQFEHWTQNGDGLDMETQFQRRPD